MKYWWVNQNQTYKQEIEGGYLWSPKFKSNGAFNYFYDTMKHVKPGDLVFSFFDTKISYLSWVESYCYDSLKPQSFVSSENNWASMGWKVDVSYFNSPKTIRPADHMAILGPFLPKIYSPLQANGNGNQGVYLTEVPEAMAKALLALLDFEFYVKDHQDVTFKTDREDVELKILEAIGSSPLEKTEYEALRTSRVGQGLFRRRVLALEKKCKISHVEDPQFLIASHIKPWSHSNNAERLDGQNGILLCPNADRLFDRGFITFEGSGKIVLSDVIEESVALKLGVNSEMNIGDFRREQSDYLKYHQDHIFLGR